MNSDPSMFQREYFVESYAKNSPLRYVENDYHIVHNRNITRKINSVRSDIKRAMQVDSV